MKENQRNSLPPAGRPQPGAVHVHIEHLLLDGFKGSGQQLQRFAGELARELERSLSGRESGQGPPTAASGRQGVPEVSLPTLDLNPRAAARIAAAVVSRLPAGVRPGRSISYGAIRSASNNIQPATAAHAKIN